MVPKTSGVVWEYLGDEKTSSALLWNIQSPKTTLPERQKGLENTFLWGLQEDPESASQTNKKPMWSTRQTGSAFFLKPYKFQMTCWWLLTFASCTTETSFTRKTQDNMLSIGGVKSSQVFLLTSRPFPWHRMFSQKEKVLQANAIQPSLLFIWFKADLN